MNYHCNWLCDRLACCESCEWCHCKHDHDVFDRRNLYALQFIKRTVVRQQYESQSSSSRVLPAEVDYTSLKYNSLSPVNQWESQES